MARTLHQAAPAVAPRVTRSLMNLPFSSFFAVCLLVLPTLHGQTPTPAAPAVDELVAKNLEAKGGAAALAAIQTVRFEGRQVVNQGQL